MTRRTAGPLVTGTCAYCGEPFRAQRRSRRYCERACGDAAQREGVTAGPRVACAGCGAPLPPGSCCRRAFCSKACRYRARRRSPAREREGRATRQTCPLPWERLLRSRRPLHGRERDAAIAWLEANGWTPVGDATWRDPLPLASGNPDDGNTLENACRRQVTREAQVLLEPRGWQCTGSARGGVWIWAPRVRKQGIGERSLWWARDHVRRAGETGQ